MSNNPILIVDDEVFVRMYMRMVLEAEGFRIIEAEDANVAMNILQDFCPCIAALIADVKMPGNLNGLDVADRLRLLHPQTPILMVSGYAPEHLRITEKGYGFLPKPFRPDQLITAVKRILPPD